MRSFRNYSAFYNLAWNAWASENVIAGVALDILYHVHSFDTLAENDIPSIAPCARMGSDEELSREELE